MKNRKKNRRPETFGKGFYFGFATLIVLIFAIIALVKYEWPSEFVSEFIAHKGIKTTGTTPIRIARVNKTGGGGNARGFLIEYQDGWRVLVTSGHVFARDFGAEAEYQILSNDGNQIAFIEEILKPKDLNIKTPFTPDIVICKLGERTMLPAIDNGQPIIHEKGLAISPVKLTPLDASLPVMTIDAVIDWSSVFPVFVAHEESEAGFSGSGYFDERGNLFILSGSLGPRCGTLFVPMNPVKLKQPTGIAPTR